MLDFVGGMNLSCLVVRIFILLLMLMANSTQYSVSGWRRGAAGVPPPGGRHWSDRPVGALSVDPPGPIH